MTDNLKRHMRWCYRAKACPLSTAGKTSSQARSAPLERATLPAIWGSPRDRRLPHPSVPVVVADDFDH